MGSPANVASTLPRRTQLQDETSPKRGVAAALSASSPESVLRSVLAANKGFASVYNPNNVQVIVADPERRSAAQKYNAGSELEFWPASEMGTTQFPRPVNTNGKSVLEIYSPDLARDPNQLRTAIYGDLMHGMAQSPYWKSLRDQFMQNFTPQELKRQQQRQTWWDDVNKSKGTPFGPTYDAYIRGWIANEGNGIQGQKESGNTMYSPRQLQILQQMKDYLESGRVPNGR